MQRDVDVKDRRNLALLRAHAGQILLQRDSLCIGTSVREEPRFNDPVGAGEWSMCHVLRSGDGYDMQTRVPMFGPLAQSDASAAAASGLRVRRSTC